MSPMAEPRSERDRGAILVLAAMMLTAVTVSAALVVDLGLARQARRQTQSAADLAALAAGDGIGADNGPNGRQACHDAVAYLRANVPTLPAGTTVPCDSIPLTCSLSSTPMTVTDGGTAGGWTVEITHPVPDSEIVDGDVAATNSLRIDDGIPCERLSVSIERTFDSLFGGVVGKSDYTIGAMATMRQIQAQDRRVPSLWLLDPTGCPTLDVQGGSHVTVGTASTPGLITVDSDASACSGNSFTIDVGGSGSSLTAVPANADPPAQISLVAMERLQSTCATGNLQACDPADVSAGTLSPQPVRRADRATRAPVDHRYNCKNSYPQFHGIDVDPCTSGTPAYIDQLRAAMGGIGTPAGFQRWTDTYDCNNPTVPAGGLGGNWHIDCNTFRISNADVQFNDGNVVFDGDISMTGGSLTMNAANPTPTVSSSCAAALVGCLDQSTATSAWVFMRDGDLSLTGGVLVANRTMIYQENGHFSIAGGSPPVWSAPTEGPFTGLAVWSEAATNKYKINGGASMQLEGVFFTPEASPFTISGGAPVVPQMAQFVSYQLAISGGASLTLSPNPTLAVVLPADAPLLIR